MPDWFSHNSNEAQAHAEVTNTETHKSKISHELLVSAASFAVRLINWPFKIAFANIIGIGCARVREAY